MNQTRTTQIERLTFVSFLSFFLHPILNGPETEELNGKDLSEETIDVQVFKTILEWTNDTHTCVSFSYKQLLTLNSFWFLFKQSIKCLFV